MTIFNLSTNQVVQLSAVPVGYTRSLTNLGSPTIYYGRDRNVSATHNVGSLVSTGTITTKEALYLVSPTGPGEIEDEFTADAGGVGGAGTVTSVTAGGAEVVIGGTPSDPTIRTATLDVIASTRPPAADVAMNNRKITGAAAGVAGTDVATVGQISVSGAPVGSTGPGGTPTAVTGPTVTVPVPTTFDLYDCTVDQATVIKVAAPTAAGQQFTLCARQSAGAPVNGWGITIQGDTGVTLVIDGPAFAPLVGPNQRNWVGFIAKDLTTWAMFPFNGTDVAGTLAGLSDVAITAPADEHFLDFVGSTAKWTNRARVRPGYSTDPWTPTANTGAKIMTLPRTQITSNLGALTSQRQYLVALPYPLRAGVPYSGICFQGGTTGAGTPLNQWFSIIRKSDLAHLRSTADDTTTAWAANTQKRIFLSSRVVTDAAITTGTATLTSATAAFTSADTGQQITVLGAGAAGAPLGTSAAPVTMTFVNATTVTLSANASTTVAAATAYISQPYTPIVDTVVYLGIVTVATTVPSLAGVNQLSTNNAGVAPIYSGNSATNYTTPVADGTTAVLSTPQSSIPFAYVD